MGTVPPPSDPGSPPIKPEPGPEPAANVAEQYSALTGNERCTDEHTVIPAPLSNQWPL